MRILDRGRIVDEPVDPEREMVRRVAPWGLPAALVALLIGAPAGGWGTGASAPLGVALVVLNFVAAGLSLARAARVSLTAYAWVVMGGFVVRLGVILGVMAALNRLSFFSPLAFGLGVVPSLLALLALEMRLYARGLGRGLVIGGPSGRRAL